MSRVKVGMFAKSLAGHDKNKIYFIQSANEEYVYLVDGTTRSISNPKKKKLKHIQLILEPYRIEENSIDMNRDEHIRRLIKEYKKEHSN